VQYNYVYYCIVCIVHCALLYNVHWCTLCIDVHCTFLCRWLGRVPVIAKEVGNYSSDVSSNNGVGMVGILAGIEGIAHWQG
jgi:hypothetical protein